MAAGLALPAVADLFKGSFDESLKKFVQPAAVIPATVLTFLNLLLVYPTLEKQGWSIAEAFKGLDDLWKAAVVLGTILVLGYVLLNLGTSILRLATGEAWLDSKLGQRLRNGQIQDREELEQRALGLADAGQRAAANRLMAEYASLPRAAHVAPTQMGNVLNGMAQGVYDRYGIDVGAFLPHLQAVMAKDEKPLATVIDDEAGAFGMILNLAAVVAFVAIEAIVLGLAFGTWAAAALASLLLPVAYLLYRASVSKARGYADAVEAAFDLYRDDLATALGLDVPKGFDKARDAWSAASRFVLYNHDEDGELVDPADPAGSDVTLRPSRNLKAELVATSVTPQKTPTPSATSSGLEVSWLLHYLVAAASTSRFTADAFLAVIDKRVRSAPAVPIPDSINSIALSGTHLAPVDKSGAGILWRLASLGPRSSAMLSYDITYGSLVVTVDQPGLTVAIGDGADDPNRPSLEIDVTGSAPVAYSIKVSLSGTRFASGDVLTAACEMPDGDLVALENQPVQANGTVSWVVVGLIAPFKMSVSDSGAPIDG